MSLQKTLKQTVLLEGVGIHSGSLVRMALKPGMPNTGIVFLRTDLEGQPQVLADYKNIVSTEMAVTLAQGRAKVSTVEHVLAAFHGMGVDNALVELDGPEVPILDGSSQIFCDAIASAGLQSQLQHRSYLVLKKKIEVCQGEKWAIAEPSSHLTIEGSIDWSHPFIGQQKFQFKQGYTDFQELARARTFGFLKDSQVLKQKGLALGVSLENAIILDGDSVLNPKGLRFPDEFVRHKVLDALGDFKLAGLGICASIRLHRAGHFLHHQLLLNIFKNPENYVIFNQSEPEESNACFMQTLLARSLVT